MCIKHHSESGQPCGFSPCEAYKTLKKELAYAKMTAELMEYERDKVSQVSAEICPDCGWAMKFPDEPCRNCEVHVLRKEVDTLRQDRDRLTGIVEKADALYQASKFQCFRKEFEKAQDDYQEARHG